MSGKLHTPFIKGVKNENHFDQYITHVKNTLLGRQPKVIILHRFFTDLVNELKRLMRVYTDQDYHYLKTAEKLLNRDVDYVRDNEYIDHIKFILEHRYPELITHKSYISFVFDALDIKNADYERMPSIHSEYPKRAIRKRVKKEHTPEFAVVG